MGCLARKEERWTKSIGTFDPFKETFVSSDGDWVSGTKAGFGRRGRVEGIADGIEGVFSVGVFISH